MATTKDLIKQALRNIGVTASGEEPDGAEINDSLLIAQQMVDAWSLERLMVPAVVHESFAIDTVGAQATYTMGTGGDLSTARPIKVVDVRDRDSGGQESPVEIVGLAQWAAIDLRSTVTRPTYCYFEPAYPLAKLYFDSIPEAGHTLKIVSHKEITALPALNADTAYPPGYDRCIRLNLEVELAIAFERPVNPEAKRLATMAKKQIKRMNQTPLHARVDTALVRGRRYNINTGPE